MYKIYINDKPLYLESFDYYNSGDATNLSAVYMGKPVTLLQYVDSLEKTTKLESIHIYAKDVEKLKADFFKLYEVIDAAGGIVKNEENEILVIFRRGSWDIAKGKIDEGETTEVAAVREVEEETGIENITLKEQVGITYHTYMSKKGKRQLKRTYWFDMEAPKQNLTPQVEEDIEKVEWVALETFLMMYRPIYPNITDILQQYKAKL